MKGARLSTQDGISRAVVELSKRALEAKAVDSVLIPLATPAKDSYAYVILRDPGLLERAEALPPVMPVQGAKALASIARAAEGKGILAVMRPCEARAAVELCKLEQIDLGRVVLLSIDCPGALPLSDYLDGKTKSPSWSDPGGIRPICTTCVNFGTAGDLHAATLGLEKDSALLLSATENGSAFLDSLGMCADSDASAWEKAVSDLTAKHKAARTAAQAKLAAEVKGLDGLVEFFSRCIGCHNCRSVCPVCYCRQCYIDGDAWESPAADYLGRATGGGAMRFPPDTVLFHVGRMAHMSLSCVSCGACEDACPADIPVAQLFGVVARETQELFDYEPGSDVSEPVPLATFEKEELHAFED